MELVDRYLQAVTFWLPKAQKQDIIAELSEDIRSQIEEKEAELGRTLNEAEVAPFLKQLGRPVLVANRYLPQQFLIGPVLFPVYRFVLKIVALFYLVPWILVWIGFMTFDPGYRFRHSGGSLIGAFGSLWGALWVTALFAFGAVTIVFAVVERAQTKSGFLANWDPRKLPAVRDPTKIPRASCISELVGMTVFCLWWIQLRSPIILEQSGITITLTAVWQYLFWGLLILGLATVAMSAVNLFRPYWTPVRASIRLITDLLGVALFCWVCNSDILAGISVPGVAPTKALQITNAINLWMARSIPFAIIVGAVIAAFDVHRILRANAGDNRPTGARMQAGGVHQH